LIKEQNRFVFMSGTG